MGSTGRQTNASSQAETTEAVLAALNPRVLSAGHHRAASGYRYLPARKRVPQFYFWYVAAGAGSVRIDGRWTEMSRGDFLVLRPGQRYQEERADDRDPSRIYFSYIDPFGRSSPRLAAALGRLLPTRVPCPAQARAEELFADLLEVYTMGGARRAVRLKVLALEVLDLVLASAEVRAGPLDARHRELARRAQEFIERNVERRLTPEMVAEEADTSASHLFAVFRRHVGCSPMRYQTELRLRAASRQLMEGRSVTATARAAGFASLHYFSRLFRKRYGVPPSEFARRVERK